MCKFCNHIFDRELLFARTHKGSIKNILQIQERKLFSERENKDGYIDQYANVLALVVDTGDPFNVADLDDITYCPYCGENLKERQNEN